MPKTTKSGQPNKDELPSTLQRSPAKAQRTLAKAYDAAADTYDGDGERAGRTAFAAVKRGFEKVGDHWEPKDEKGPSDESAETPGRKGRTAGGVDANASKAHLYDLAKRLDVPGRSGMTKDQLVEALQKANEKATRASR
ncbi:MAG: ChaB family protein [Mycobacteriales bacterium]